MSISQNFPTTRPTLSLNFARSKTLDPRITFTRASTATYFDREGVVRTAAVNQARFDHNPTTGESLGLLVEEQRTNLLTYSADFSNGNWSKQNSHPITIDAALAPDGTFTADAFVRTSVIQYIFQQVAGSGTYTLSAWVRSANATGTFVMQPYNGVDGSPGATTFTATSTWQRFSITSTVTAGASGWYPCIPVNINETFYVWGAQLESGSFRTSYIPTVGSQVVRSADSGTITGSNLSSWWNQGEGTFIMEHAYGSFYNQPIAISDNVGNAWLYTATNGELKSYYVPQPTETIIQTGNILSINTMYKFAASYSSSSGKSVTYNGLTPYTSTNTDIRPSSLLFLGSFSGNYIINSTIKKLTYYPKRLTNTQLQALTK